MKITINGLHWTVKVVDKSKLDENGERVFGLTSFDNLEISIDKSLPARLIKRTVIHELTHATLFSYGFMGDSLNEEMICNFMETHCELIYKQTLKVLEMMKHESN